MGTKEGRKTAQCLQHIKCSAGKVELIENYALTFTDSILFSGMSMAGVILGLFSLCLVLGADYVLGTGDMRET